VQFDFADIGALPHFNQDLYVEPLPAAVQHFRDQIAAADGLVISSSRLLRLSPAVFVPSTSFGKR
jgi:NAD(P)H-dependent FMN reductase